MNLSPVSATLIGSCLTLAGVVLKIAYDAVVESLRSRRESGDKFISERRELYDAFLEIHRKQKVYQNGLHELALKAVSKTPVPPGRLERFPSSSLSPLIEASEKIRFISKNFTVIEAARSIVQTHVDFNVANQNLVSLAERDHDREELQVNEITWFLLQQYMIEWERAFEFAYREELGLGAPKGAPKDYKEPADADFRRNSSFIRSLINGQRDRDKLLQNMKSALGENADKEANEQS